MYMSVAQLNLNLTPEFERNLRRLMKARGITKKSDAVRIAVREAAERPGEGRRSDPRSWVGLATGAPENPKPVVRTEDELWGEE